MQLGRAKTGIVKYGWKPTPKLAQSQAVQLSANTSIVGPTALTAGRRTMNWDETTGWAFVAAFTASTATVLVCDPCVPVVPPEGFVLDESLALEPQIYGEQVTIGSNEVRPAASVILEMRPVHKSLRDVPREKMSEFERNYPW